MEYYSDIKRERTVDSRLIHTQSCTVYSRLLGISKIVKSRDKKPLVVARILRGKKEEEWLLDRYGVSFGVMTMFGRTPAWLG